MLGISAWIVWLIIGIVSAVLEIFVPGIFFIAFGIAGVLTSPLSLLGFPIWVQIIIFAIFSFLSYLLMRKMYLKLTAKDTVETNVYALVGKKGIVVTAIKPNKRGYVKIGGEEWSALSEDNQEILKGKEIEIVSIDGNKVIVKPL